MVNNLLKFVKTEMIVNPSYFKYGVTKCASVLDLIALMHKDTNQHGINLRLHRSQELLACPERGSLTKLIPINDNSKIFPGSYLSEEFDL